MTQPTQDDFATCEKVLQHMAKSLNLHEPHAVVTIGNLETVLSEHDFIAEDYPTDAP